jgi:hypothetical protein
MKAKIGAVRRLMPCPSFVGEKSKILVWSFQFQRRHAILWTSQLVQNDKICFKLEGRTLFNSLHPSHVVKIRHLTCGDDDFLFLERNYRKNGVSPARGEPMTT